jgi:hypothetical protein
MDSYSSCIDQALNMYDDDDDDLKTSAFFSSKVFIREILIRNV